MERSKSAPKLGSIEETIEEDEDDDSPLEDDDGDVIRGKHFQCSPVGSIAISETTSDIVHYGGSSDLGAGNFLFSRSASQKSEKHHSDDEDDKSCSASDESSRVSRGESNSNNLTTTNSNSSNCSTSSCKSSSSSSNSSTNANNKNSMYVYPRKLAPSLKPPVLQRRFIRSISVDTSLDRDDLDDDFDDDETQMLSNISREFRLSCKKNSPSLRTGDNNNQFVDSNNYSTSITSKDDSSSVTDSGGEGVSIASTDTTDTVLDRPCTAEDTLSVINSLSHSLARQLSLPQDSASHPPPEESLTSDQPESLGSHSCSSSCGGCSDIGGDNGAQPHDDHHHHSSSSGGKGRDFGTCPGRELHLGTCHDTENTLESLGNLSSLGVGDEPDNISEESGYAEEKDFLQNAELGRVLNA